MNDYIDAATRESYQRQGWGTERIGFGERPALLIVDMQYDFVDAGSPATCAPMAQERLPDIQRLLEAARVAAIPIFFSQGLVARDLSDVGLWKGRAHKTGMTQLEGSRGAEIVEELRPKAGERVVPKRRPSVFFGTNLNALLEEAQVDTLLLAGSSMSGCVRATALDAFSNDYRTMIVSDCVIDRTREVLERNLFDVDSKYVDAVGLDEALDYLANIPQLVLG
jgi:maleamate amidohydrolase